MMFAIHIVPYTGVNEVNVWKWQNDDSTVDSDSVKVITHNGKTYEQVVAKNVGK